MDKTGFIRDLLDNWGEVNLFTRPRRFGKTLNMSMLKCLFEIGCNPELFRGLEIEQEQIGIVIEVKYPDSNSLEKGMKNIYAYGIACHKKHCQVVCEKLG